MRNLNSFVAFSLIFLLISCQRVADRPLRIAITKSSDNYQRWLLAADSTIDLVDLYGMAVDSAVEVLKGCDALLVTGGDDVYPGLYGQLADSVLCEGSDRYRDSLEVAAIKLARNSVMPVFGVCRGLQIINVEAGGSLIPDLPARKPSLIKHRCDDWKNCFHEVVVDTNSHLFVLVQASRGNVNTNHHQAIDRVGHGLQISALGPDGVVEAIESTPASYKGFLMAVQWHPERLTESPGFSTPLARRFVEAAILYHNRP